MLEMLPDLLSGQRGAHLTVRTGGTSVVKFRITWHFFFTLFGTIFECACVPPTDSDPICGGQGARDFL